MSTEQTQVRMLMQIAGSLKDIARLLEALNTNVVLFAQQANPTEQQKYQMRHAAEGLNYEELERRSAELLRNNPTSAQIPKEGE